MAIRVFKQKIYIKISDILDGISCLKKIKTKNLDQNKDILVNYLIKDHGCSKESANKVIENAAKENMVEIVLFNGKNSFRIVENEENTIIVPEMQLNDTKLNDRDATEDIPEEGNALTTEEHQYAEKCQKIIQKIEKNLARYKDYIFEFLIT